MTTIAAEHLGLVIRVARQMNVADQPDAIQEGRIAAWQADQKLDRTRDPKEQASFIAQAIRWRIMDFLEKDREIPITTTERDQEVDRWHERTDDLNTPGRSWSGVMSTRDHAGAYRLDEAADFGDADLFAAPSRYEATANPDDEPSYYRALDGTWYTREQLEEMMATIIPTPIEHKRAANGAYPWAEWLNGRHWALHRGIDFDTTPAKFLATARTTAIRKGLKGRFTGYVDGDTVHIQADPEPVQVAR